MWLYSNYLSSVISKVFPILKLHLNSSLEIIYKRIMMEKKDIATKWLKLKREKSNKTVKEKQR